MKLHSRAAAYLAFAALFSASAQAQPAPEVVAPNANLHIEGIPPIPKALADGVARYSDFRGHRFVAWHPKKAEMKFS